MLPKYEQISPVLYTLKDVIAAYDKEEYPKIFERIDNVVININKNNILLGRVCYQYCVLLRKGEFKLKVLSNTLSTERCIIAKQLLRYIYELYTDGVRAGTIHSRVKIIIIFFEFATQNNNVIRKDLSSIEKAIADYSAFLLHKIKIYDKSLNIGLTASTAHNYQTWVLSFSAFLLDIAPYKLIKGELEINSNTRQTRKTRSLPAEVIETDFNQYTTIFKTFTDMLLEDEIFPKTFELNKEKYWITHAGEIIHSSSARLKKPNVFNFDKSRNYTIDELIHLKSYKDKSKRNEAIKLFNQRKLKANTKYCSDRAYLALHACRAYFIHFLYLTGANDSTAASIVFNSNYIIENSEINFKSIKWRANGQEVKYDIQTEFIADFKKYIQIREYLLQCYDTNSDSLFLDVYKNKLVSAPVEGDYGSKIKASASVVFNKNNFVSTSKTIRVSKGVWVRKNYGNLLSSYILQHSQKTLISHYTATDEDKSSEELIAYFASLSDQVITQLGNEHDTNVGQCNGLDKQNSIEPPLIIDCVDKNTCFFCSNYRVHADETDIRKILSIKYLILQSAPLAASEEHFNSIYSLILDRIDNFIDAIKCVGSEQKNMVLEVTKEVFKEELLSDYWYKKLELIEELGLI